VTVITAEDIQKSGAKTVQEAIQWATGIVMYDSIGNAFQQTIDLIQIKNPFVDVMPSQKHEFERTIMKPAYPWQMGKGNAIRDVIDIFSPLMQELA